MSTTLSQPKTPQNNALMALASKLKVDHAALTQTLKQTVFSVTENRQTRPPTNEEFLALAVTANTYDLNPILRELYAFPKKGGGIVPVVSVDGWLKIINRQPNFDGMDVDVFHDDNGTPTHATCTIHLKDRKHPVRISEYFAECSRNTEPWNQMPSRMLRHKAIKEAARVAFGIGGIVDEDEAETLRDVTPTAPSSMPSGPAMPKPRGQRLERSEEPAPASAQPRKEEASEPEGELFIIDGVKTRTGKSQKTGRDWKLYIITFQVDGEPATIEASTFSETIGGIAEFNEGKWARAVIKTEGDRSTVESLEIVSDAEGEEEGGLM
ncbi:recombinase RecT [Roseibacillus ishigakijimensis]|uniref:Recombinase RecT n=1 Tax=Roseibacillus ishigakijimensis TaxID=454146 RepID=A0A934VNE7_9BACT|nr:RecT family recombinase [Roseibacillus ishigakijimensis]MBK1835036.1 recombinase RecT [Roseibacillus ishigakijimensis]